MIPTAGDLHQHSVCDPVLEILDVVHQSNPMNPLEEECTAFQSSGGALEQSNKHSQIIFIDGSQFLLID